ncbi:MAG TPA: GNAT family N-acetyltransferase [Caulobacteraceae bacterium]
MTPEIRFEALADHDRSGFSCGEPDLDAYFQRQIGQDVRRSTAAAYVAVDEVTGKVAAFYTISATSLRLEALPMDLARKLPRYPLVPAALIGRMAVAQDWQGKGLGEAVLAEAAYTAIASGLGVYALLVRPKNDAARRFYLRHGFVTTADGENMLLPLATARRGAGR